MQPRDLSDHVAYEAGRGVEEVARDLGLDPDDLVKLSSNENALGPSPAAVEAIRQGAGALHSYPKSSHTDLRDAVAAKWDCAPGQVWLANGGDGALDYLARAAIEPGDEVLVSKPGFAYYAMSARYHHGEVNEFRLPKADDFEQSPERVLDAYDGERVVYLTSPHNPTGTEVTNEEVVAIADGTDEETLVVVDEAYGEFARSPSARELLGGDAGEGGRDDVAVLRTFSKAYGLAGVRLGYALVPGAWADAYARVNTPFAASELACRAGLAALDDEEHVERTVSVVRSSRDYIREHLDAPTWPSAGNFVLAEVGDASAVAEAAQEQGVIIRDCTSFGLPDCVRVTCGTREETERAVSTINGVLEAGP